MDKITLLALFTSLVNINTAEENGCKVVTEYEDNNLWFMNVECSSSTARITNAISNRHCTETEQRRSHDGYNYYWEKFYVYEFRINLHVNNINFQQNTPFADVGDLISRVIKLRLDNTKMVALSEHIQIFTKLNEIELQTELDVMELNKFLIYEEMVKINVSKNHISALEQSQENIHKTSKVTAIDLSHNRIEAIPNNYFSCFPDLHHLNISHNHLKSIDILTFEGVLKLKTFQISSNNLTEIGNYLIRFVNLEEILLDNNMLSAIAEPNFRTMTKLQRLNVSSNMISSIEERSFESLVLLTDLDMGNNKISKVDNIWFSKNTNLQTVILSNNIIKVIEPDVFTGKHVTHFDIKNNCLTGELKAETFAGIHTDILDLSNGNITVIASKTFNSLYVQSLNLSSNKITNIEKLTFTTLDMLEQLDLSMNFLNAIEFEMVQSNILSVLNAKNNSIENIKETSFKNLFALVNLDLSHNLISLIGPQSFQSLSKLNTLALNNNALQKTLQANLFQGLSNLTDLNLSFTRTLSYENETFSGLRKLVFLNSSHGELTNISYNAFILTDSIEILDLSYNLIQVFQLNTSTIIHVKEMRLNNNLLSEITNETFFGLLHLESLYLAENNIARIYQTELMTLSRLSTLDLSFNTNLEINGSAFSNLENLVKLTLTKVKGKINFEHVSNTSIEILSMTECNILDVGKIFIHKLANAESITLARNKIKFLDKLSFQTMLSLTWLDLSDNLISNIQPGTFINTNKIFSLNLHGNQLTHLQFGVFTGLKILQTLNLSNNALHSFSINILHNNPIVDTIILDNNVLNFKFEEFANTSITNISIGGNPISCEALTKLKKNINYYGFKRVGAVVKDYNSENVAGISCISNKISNKTWQLDVNDSNISSMQILTAMQNIIINFRDSVEKFNNNINTSLSAIPTKVSDNSSAILDMINDLARTINSSQNTEKLIESNTKLQKSLDNVTDISIITSNLTILFYTSIKDFMKNLTIINEKSIEKYINNNTIDTKVTDEHLIEKIKKLIESNTKLQKSLDNVTDISIITSNLTILFYTSIKDFMKNLTIINEKSIEKYINNKTIDTKVTDDHLIEKIKIINDEKDKIVIELKEIIKELKDENNFKSNNQESTASSLEHYGDIKGILYFIAVCLSISIVTSLSITVYRLFFLKDKLGQGNSLHNSVCSTRPISNVIEMQ